MKRGVSYKGTVKGEARDWISKGGTPCTSFLLLTEENELISCMAFNDLAYEVSAEVRDGVQATVRGTYASAEAERSKDLFIEALVTKNTELKKAVTLRRQTERDVKLTEEMHLRRRSEGLVPTKEGWKPAHECVATASGWITKTDFCMDMLGAATVSAELRGVVRGLGSLLLSKAQVAAYKEKQEELFKRAMQIFQERGEQLPQ